MNYLDLLKSAPELVKFIMSGKTWKGVHNGKALTSVERLDAGQNIEKGRVWVSAVCHDGVSKLKFMGSSLITEVGQRGGADAITVAANDGVPAEVAQDDIVIGVQLHFPHLVLALAYKFDDARGEHQRYEFTTNLI